MLLQFKRSAAVAAVTLLAIPLPAFADGPPFDISAAAERSILEAGKTQRVHMRISIKGKNTPAARARTPMNIALVIDRSGSMQGPRIEGARRAAIAAIDRLSPKDIVSVVSYDDKIEVHVPATRATNPAALKEHIRAITARGSTAIWAGMQAGAAEVRKFHSRDSINRIILLSDGLANVGPSEPRDFERLGRQLASEGITVSTIGLGLGYNEDLMAKLARSTDGAHAFVQEPADLTTFLNREFDDLQAVVAQELEIRIRCLPGTMPIRSLGREARVEGDSIVYNIGQIKDGVERVLVSELEVTAPATAAGLELAHIDVGYQDVLSGGRRVARSKLRVGTGSAAQAEASFEPIVARDVAVLLSREQRQEAVLLRDQGRIDEANKQFQATEAYLNEQKRKLPNAAGYDPIEREVKANQSGAAAKTAADWDQSRKAQVDFQFEMVGARINF